MHQQRKADLLLVMVTAFWGASYFLTDLCLETIPTPGREWTNGPVVYLP